MPGLISDARDAVRMVVRNIGLTVTQLCVFAITIGATTTAFTVVDGVFLTPVPFPEAESLIHVWNGFERSRTDVVNVNSFKALRDANRSMAAMSAYLEVPMAEFSRPTEEHIVARVSASFFDEVLRVDPLLGRTFTRSDELADSEPVAIISHEFWVSRFSSDPGVLGRRVLLQDYPSLAIVGVLPPGFRSPRTLKEPAGIWTLAESGPPINPRMLFKIFGRLRPNVSLEQAQAELETIQGAVAREGGEAMLGRQLRIGSIEELYGRPETRTAILLVFRAVVAVLLIGLANLAAVELARLPEYEGDLALRAALGAPPLRLARLMVVKSLIVSIAGGVSGTLLAAASHGILLANLPSAVPRVLDIRIDGQVLLFSIALSAVSGLLIGIFPAIRASGSDVRSLVQATERSSTGNRRHRIYRNALTCLQSAVALILLIAAALLVRSFWNVTSIDLGFDPNDLVTMSVSLPQSNEGAQYAAVMHDVLDELNKMENVDVAAVSTGLPMFSVQGLRTSSAGPDGEVRQVSGANGVSASYFDALRIRILEGRTFSPSEARNGTPLAILSEGAARTLFPEGDPVGKFVRTQVGATEAILSVVGIVDDVRPILFFEKLPTVYVTSGLLDRGEFIGFGGPGVFLVARTTLKQEDVKRVVANIRPDAVTRFERMEDRLSINQASHRFRMFVLGAFAAIAAALAAIGVYSVLAYAVRQRTRELGIRMSLGAQRSGLFWYVVRWALPPALAGLLIGLGVSYAFAEVAAAYVYEIQPRDTVTYLFATLFLLTVLLVGAVLPAIRAARLDPIRALRYE